MALTVDRLDYSPIYQGISQEYHGKGLQLQEQIRQHQTVTGLIDLGLSIGSAIYNKVAETKAAEWQVERRQVEQEAEQKQRDIILNQTYEWEHTGGGASVPGEQQSPENRQAAEPEKSTIKMPQEYEDWYQQKLKAIDEKYSGFPKIQEAAREQTYQAYAGAKNNVLTSVYNQAIREHAALDQQVITDAQTDAIRHHDPRMYEAAIESAKSIGPDAKKALTEIAAKQYTEAIDTESVVSATKEGGQNAGIKQVDALVAAGKRTAAEAEDLKKAVYQVHNEQAAVLNQGATETFSQAMSVPGTTAESAMKKAMANTPLPWQEEVRAHVLGEYGNAVKQADDVANREMLAVHDANPNDWWTLSKALHDREKQYGKKMTVSTYTFWENMIERLKPKPPDEGDGTTQQAWDKLRDITRDPFQTSRDMMGRIQALGNEKDAKGNLILGDKVLNEYLTRVKDGNYTNRTIDEQYDAIVKWTQTSAFKQGKDPTQANVAAAAAMKKFSDGIRDMKKRIKEPTDEEIIKLAYSVMDPTKTSFTFPFNDAGAGKRFLSKLNGTDPYVPTSDEMNGYTEYASRRATSEYGVQGLIQYGEGDRGTPIFRGIFPGDPLKQPAFIRYALDQKGDEELQVLDATSNWVPASSKGIHSVATIRAGERASSSTKAQLLLKQGESPAAVASATGLTPEEVKNVQIVTDTEPSAALVASVNKWIGTRRKDTKPITDQEIADQAVELGMTSGRLRGILQARGLVK